MQGHKPFVEKTHYQFRFSDRIPPHNIYRKLKEVLDWNFLYGNTKRYYGRCGHCSVDPVIFFKLALVGYLENIASDRKLIERGSPSIARCG